MRVDRLFFIGLGLLLSAPAKAPVRAQVATEFGSQPQVQLPYLHVAGRRLVGSDGREVRLRGVNVGGWLVTETWMCGITDTNDTREAGDSAGGAGRFTQETLEARFGDKQAKRLSDAWQDNWIRAEDLDDIQKAGFNLIRVPFSYRTLQHPDGRWIRNASGQIDFSRMDWIVQQAGQRGLYTIFDLHVWPEQRSSYEKVGRRDGADIRRSMSQLWAAIAAHYRGVGSIAGFDLINELPGAGGVQQVLSEAVRRSDPDRVQIVEGFSMAEFIQLRRRGEFPNSMFSEHFYGAAPLTTSEIDSRLAADTTSPVPVYIGEFLARDFAAAASDMSDRNVSWSSWTYKTVDMGDWGIVDYDQTVKVDVERDSFESILSKWTAGLSARAEGHRAMNRERRLSTSRDPA